MIRETHLREARQTVKLGLVKVVHDLFPDEALQISYSILEGVFCGLDDSVLSVREVREIERRLRAWVADGAPIEDLGRADGYHRYRVGDVVAPVLYPAQLDPARVEPFEIVPFSTGFIVDFGDVGRGSDRPLIPPVLLAEAFEANRLVDKGMIHPTVSQVFPLAEAGEAALQVHRNLHQGKVGVLVLAEAEGLGVTDQDKRDRFEAEINRFRGV